MGNNNSPGISNSMCLCVFVSMMFHNQVYLWVLTGVSLSVCGCVLCSIRNAHTTAIVHATSLSLIHYALRKS